MDAVSLLNSLIHYSKSNPLPQSPCSHQTQDPLFYSSFYTFSKSFHLVGLTWNRDMPQCYILLHKYFKKIKADCNRNSGSH